jgi:hypothetical protein
MLKILCRHIGKISDTDINYYNLKGKNLVIQGDKITIIMMSLIITITVLFYFILHMNLSTHYKNGFYLPCEYLL